MTELPLQGRSVVIIGGTTGLGLSAAFACARAGAGIVACGRNPASVEAAKKNLGDQADVFIGDATDRWTAEEAIRRANARFGRFDALYHVAGGSGRQAGDGPLHEVTDEAIEMTLRLNLISLLYSNRAAVLALLEQGQGGSILNMGSVLGNSPSPKFFATHVYAAAKSAVIGFTKSCASYYAPHNVRFNVISPALVDTPMAGRAVGDDVIRRFAHRKQPLDGGRVGRPEDLDAAVVFFLSDESRFVTGQVLAVDGGWTVSEGAMADV